ncbi:MAG TPA: hypothetical protein ENN19_14400 [Chloroflexi bacterium]|nr:hypothetical protein [Chloroflexota bacterium]
MGTENKKNGQSMVELALVLPFLILLLVATVEAGFAFRDYLILQSVNREGSRWAVRTAPGNVEYFQSEVVHEIFGRVLNAADEAGLRTEDLDIIVTHVYIDDDGPAYKSIASPGFDANNSRLNLVSIAQDNADKAAQINAARIANDFAPLANEMVVVEVFYRHETVWGFERFNVGPLSEDWIMHAHSSMRLVGTGRTN